MWWWWPTLPDSLEILIVKQLVLGEPQKIQWSCVQFPTQEMKTSDAKAFLWSSLFIDSQDWESSVKHEGLVF